MSWYIETLCPLVSFPKPFDPDFLLVDSFVLFLLTLMIIRFAVLKTLKIVFRSTLNFNTSYLFSSLLLRSQFMGFGHYQTQR